MSATADGVDNVGRMSAAPTPQPLVDWLRAQDDHVIVDLLRARADLATPAPADTGVLATRAALRGSVGKAVDGLDAFILKVLDALVLVEADHTPVPLTTVLGWLGPAVPEAAARAALARLTALAICWGSEEAISLVGSAREVVGGFPAGLGASNPDLLGRNVAAMINELDEPSLRILQALERASTPVGATAAAGQPLPPEPGRTPVQRLLAEGLLIRRDAGNVEMPREVGAALRGATPLGPIQVDEPRPATRSRSQSAVDSAGAGEAMETVRHLEILLRLYSDEPAPALRAGGLGVREIRRLARELGGDEARAGMIAELAAAAGLIATSEHPSQEWIPTHLADSWLGNPAEPRWLTVATAWLTLPRYPALVDGRDQKDRPLNTLSPESRQPGAVRERLRVLGVLAELGSGVGVTDVDQIIRVTRWRAPRDAGRVPEDTVRWIITEAEALGVTALGALTSAGRALLGDDNAAAGKAMGAAMPDPVDHVLVQADLTIVAPGWLEPDLAAELALVAEVESGGSATVYRVGESSLRRALDAGRSATDLHELLRTRSRTPIPQALTYLIDDVARRHGVLRGGVASSFLRCDDELLIAQVLGSPGTIALGLRRIAPTVLISELPLIELVDGLRAAGFAPVAEDPDGRILDLRPGARRIPTRGIRQRPPAGPTAPDTERLHTVVHRMRAADQAAAVTRGVSVTDESGRGVSATLALLRDAVRANRDVCLSFVDAHGVSTSRLVTPVSVTGGVLQGFDHATTSPRRFPLHRIHTVALVEGDL